MARYIDKDILIDLVNRTSVYAWDTETYISAHEWVLSLIDEIPEAEIEPVRYGKWERNTGIDYRLYEMANGECYYEKVAKSCRCSECWGTSDFLTNYCPNCGAKMDKEQEHE